MIRFALFGPALYVHMTLLLYDKLYNFNLPEIIKPTLYTDMTLVHFISVCTCICNIRNIYLGILQKSSLIYITCIT